MRRTLKRLVKPSILLMFLIGIFIFLRYTNVVEYLTKDNIEAFISSMGPLGGVVFMGLYFLATLLFLPGTPLSVAGGFLFGPVLGTVYIVLGATLGASGAFFVSRFLGKDFVDRILKNKFEKLNAFDHKLSENGFLTVLFLRLVPLFPFNGLNFALGLTMVKFRDFFLATLVGIIPGSFVLANIGGSATDITDPKFFLFIALFILLAAVPPIYTKIKQRNGAKDLTKSE